MDGLMSGSSFAQRVQMWRTVRNALKMKENVRSHPAWEGLRVTLGWHKMAHDFPECRGQADAAGAETPVNAGLGWIDMVLGLPERGK
jgi:hypothetical protein